MRSNAATLELGFAFTERDTPDARRRIESDLRAIAETLRAADPTLVSLALTGGFSRGEGTVRDGRPVNDYDLVAIRSRPGGGARYRALAQRLTRDVGIHVDLLPIWRKRLSRVGRKLFWLDLRLGGRVIEGDRAALSDVRRFDASDLLALEGPRLLANRAAGLLLAVPGPAQAVDVAQVDLQATKAILAAMDARLLAAGRYAPRLRERLALSRVGLETPIYARAVEWKLGGSAASMGSAWWAAAKETLLRAVEQTGARDARDGAPERAFHAIRAKRLRAQPSRDARLAAWDLLGRCEFPDGTGADWPRVKARFFAERARTLH